MSSLINHGITPEQYAKVMAQVYEPDLDWDNPSEYDLLDREELTANAQRLLAALERAGYVIQSLDDLALDEFDIPRPRPDRGRTVADDYTPSEARVCIDFCNAATKRPAPDGSFMTMEEADAAFSRWLAAHDAKVRAQERDRAASIAEEYSGPGVIPKVAALFAEIIATRIREEGR